MKYLMAVLASVCLIAGIFCLFNHEVSLFLLFGIISSIYAGLYLLFDSLEKEVNRFEAYYASRRQR